MHRSSARNQSVTSAGGLTVVLPGLPTRSGGIPPRIFRCPRNGVAGTHACAANRKRRRLTKMNADEQNRRRTRPSSTFGHGDSGGLFRREALEHHGSGRGAIGRPLRLSPGRQGWAYWLLLMIVTAAIVFGLAGRVGEYVSGPAVIRPIGGGGGLQVAALLPGSSRPQLRPGMSLTLVLSGNRPRIITTLRIGTVSAETFDPQATRRLLDADVAGTAPGMGPVVLVEARLPGPGAGAEGRRLALRAGMSGTAQVRVHSQSVLSALVPSLKAFLEKSND